MILRLETDANNTYFRFIDPGFYNVKSEFVLKITVIMRLLCKLCIIIIFFIIFCYNLNFEFFNLL